jgi:hypothetical protein
LTSACKAGNTAARLWALAMREERQGSRVIALRSFYIDMAAVLQAWEYCAA